MKKFFLFLLLIFSGNLFSQNNPAWITYFEQSGFTATPRYNETMEYFRMLADSSEYAEMKTFGISPQGRELKYLIVSKAKTFTPTESAKSNRPVLLIINGIHSGEIEGKDASMLLLREILITKEKENLIDSLTLIVVPIFNVDGHERMSRYNRINQNGPEEMGWRTTAQNLNLNRDWLKADAPEMQALLKLYSEWLPDFMIDTHTTDGADYQYSITYGVEKFSNIYSGTAEWLKNKFIPYFERGVSKRGFLIRPYISLKNWSKGLDDGITDWAATPRFSTGYAAIQNRPSLLIETHMIKPYKERVYSTKAALETVMEFISLEAPGLKRLNKEADEKSIEEFFNEKNYLPVAYKYSDKYKMVNLKGYEYYLDSSAVSGSQKLVYTNKKKDLKVKFYYDVITSDSVRIPSAYLIPAEWKYLINRMLLHGILVDTIAADTLLQVTRLKFKSVDFSKTSYEGRQRVNFEYDTYQETVNIPAGTFLILTNQRTVRVIANLLEPKAGDSFVKWGFMNAIFERKEYFEPYVMEKLAEEMLNNDEKLRNEFYNKLKNDKSFRDNPMERLNYFYERSPYFDNHYRVYPVMLLY